MDHITLPVLDEACTRVVTHEVLEVERESPSIVRLTHSPALVSGVARGDRLELDQQQLSGFRIIERGGMLAAVIGFASADQRREAQRLLGVEVQALAGICEGGPGLALVFSIPARRGIPAVEAFLQTATERFPGAGWYFGNVYGPDGQPLSWWRAP